MSLCGLDHKQILSSNNLCLFITLAEVNLGLNAIKLQDSCSFIMNLNVIDIQQIQMN